MAGRSAWAPPRPSIFCMHIPKTAGMALRLFLENQYPVSQILPANDWPELLALGLERLGDYHLFQGHFSCGLLDLLPAGLKSIVFLREPVARTISHLKHLRRDPNFHPAHHLAAGRSLDDLVRDDRVMGLCCNVQSALLSNFVPGEVILAGLRRDRMEGRAPNADVFAAEPDLTTALATLERFTFVGFVEELQDDILRLAMELGLHPPQSLPKRNFDPEGSTDLDSIEPETLAILRQRNAVDISLYESARQRFTPRPRVTAGQVGAGLLARGIYTSIAEPLELAMTGAIPGSNWYSCEAAEGGGHRWTGPLRQTTLELPLAPGFDVEVSAFVLIGDLGELAIRSGKTDLPVMCHASDGDMHRISFHIPAALVRGRGLTPIRFQTKKVFQPSDADLRPLSFLVRELAISRVEPSDTAIG